MAIDDTLPLSGSAPASSAAEPLSAEWWSQRTAEELRDIIKRGFSGGDAFEGAVAEAERRAREATKRMREAAAVEAQARRKRTIIFRSVLAAAAIAIMLVAWLSL